MTPSNDPGPIELTEPGIVGRFFLRPRRRREPKPQTEGATMIVAVVNKSTLVNDTDFDHMVTAVARQAVTDFARGWNRAPATVAAFNPTEAVPDGAAVITLVDTIEGVPAGVLGYHTESGADVQSGVVAASPELTNGGQVLTGDWSVASVLSHEVLEYLADPSCSFWAADGPNGWCLEVCDPVEAPTYVVGGVSVSNFVLPAWFDPHGKHPFDHLGLLKAPFTISSGGYAVSSHMGTETTKYGDDMPGWRREMKRAATSRTMRRRATLSPI